MYNTVQWTVSTMIRVSRVHFNGRLAVVVGIKINISAGAVSLTALESDVRVYMWGVRHTSRYRLGVRHRPYDTVRRIMYDIVWHRTISYDTV